MWIDFNTSRDSAMKPITGSIVALVTPMHEDGSVDYAALRKLIDWHVAEGTDCIGVVGTTGESPTVDCEEHIRVIALSVKFAAGRIKVLAGTGATRHRPVSLPASSSSRSPRTARPGNAIGAFGMAVAEHFLVAELFFSVD